ncbi:MAG: hypothetical protein ABIB97_01555 [Patescibacteria group bacterium]
MWQKIRPWVMVFIVAAAIVFAAILFRSPSQAIDQDTLDQAISDAATKAATQVSQNSNSLDTAQIAEEIKNHLGDAPVVFTADPPADPDTPDAVDKEPPAGQEPAADGDNTEAAEEDPHADEPPVADGFVRVYHIEEVEVYEDVSIDKIQQQEIEQLKTDLAKQRKQLARVEAEKLQLQQVLENPAVTVVPATEEAKTTTVVIVEKTVAEPTVVTEPLLTEPAVTLVPIGAARVVPTSEPKLVAYFQGGKTYVSMEAMIGSPPYFRYGGNGTWHVYSGNPLTPTADGWLVINGEWNHFQIVSTDRKWSQVGETYQPDDLGVLIDPMTNDYVYTPVRR